MSLLLKALAVLAVLAAVVGSYGYTWHEGKDAGVNEQIARQKSTDDIAEDSAARVAVQVAGYLDKLGSRQTIVNNKATHEIRTVPVYTDCKHSDGMLATINEALTGNGGAVSVPDSGVPKADAAPRSIFRLDNAEAPRQGFRVPPVPSSGPKP